MHLCRSTAHQYELAAHHAKSYLQKFLLQITHNYLQTISYVIVKSPCYTELETLQAWAEGSDCDAWSLVHETHQV